MHVRGRLWTLAVVACAQALGACTNLWPVPDAENGRYPADSLAAVTPECLVIKEVAGRLKAMLAAANAEGVGLVPEQSSFLPPEVPPPPRIESCYRSYEMQEWWRDYYCSIDKCGLAAQPGRSKHGFGRAVDLQDQLGQLTFQSPGYLWLAAHAAEYGFFQPPSVAPGGANEEAWHWETETAG
jgi:LAS superfamily LD-carboxypeptidase LdcB